MKSISIIISLVTFLAFNSYSQDKNVKQLLDNEEIRTAVFTAIANNHELMNSFMEVAKDNEHAMMMIKGNKPMIEQSGKMEMTHKQLDSQHEHQMMGHGNKMGMVKENPVMMLGTMMNMVKQDSAMYNKMADMMADSPEMMEMCMKMISDKKEINANIAGSEKESEQKVKNKTNRPRYRRR